MKHPLTRPFLLLLGLAIAILSSGDSLGQETTHLTIPANPDWTDTGIALLAGQTVTISASGQWSICPCFPTVGPDGGIYDYFHDEWQLFDLVDAGRLVGFIGPSPLQGEWGNGSFFQQTSGYLSIGSGQTFAAPYAGELWLGINDDAITESADDNSGQLEVVITVGGSDTTAPVIKIVTPTGVYAVNGKLHAAYSCTDSDYPVASCVGTYSNGAKIDSSTPGIYGFTVVATDSLGNTSSETLAYTIANVGLAPASLAFPPQYVGTGSPAQSVVLRNSQSVSLTFSGVSTSANFSATSKCPDVVPAHSVCPISVTFKPTTAGSHNSGSLSVSDGIGTQSILLFGFGSLVKLSPGDVAYGSHTVGSTSAAKNITLTNSQTVPFDVSGVTVSGDFALAPSTTCPTTGTVSAGASCIIAITFTPTGSGTRTGTITVQSDYPTAPVSVTLSGKGTS
jgi:hypothetical protein